MKDKYNVDKKDILFITDAVGDIKDAQSAGIKTVAVTWGFMIGNFLRMNIIQI